MVKIGLRFSNRNPDFVVADRALGICRKLQRKGDLRLMRKSLLRRVVNTFFFFSGFRVKILEQRAIGRGVNSGGVQIEGSRDIVLNFRTEIVTASGECIWGDGL